MRAINVTLSSEKLAELFRLGVMCAADIQCLDRQSRDKVRAICLLTCLEKMEQKCRQCEKKCSAYSNQSLTNKLKLNLVI